jgi:hypothetical protein
VVLLSLIVLSVYVDMLLLTPGPLSATSSVHDMPSSIGFLSAGLERLHVMFGSLAWWHCNGAVGCLLLGWCLCSMSQKGFYS